MLDKASANRFRTWRRERTPAAVQAELAAQEVGYQAEADWRKQQAEVNLPRWAAIRAARGQGKRKPW